MAVYSVLVIEKLTQRTEQEPIAKDAEILLAQVEAGELHWSNVANCIGVDPNLFYPERGASNKLAKAICQECVVREDCLEYALAHENFGVWGGKTERERRGIRKQRALTAARYGVASTIQT